MPSSTELASSKASDVGQLFEVRDRHGQSLFKQGWARLSRRSCRGEALIRRHVRRLIPSRGVLASNPRCASWDHELFLRSFGPTDLGMSRNEIDTTRRNKGDPGRGTGTGVL